MPFYGRVSGGGVVRGSTCQLLLRNGHRVGDLSGRRQRLESIPARIMCVCVCVCVCVRAGGSDWRRTIGSIRNWFCAENEVLLDVV
jgi:hypothetical protein